MNENAKRLREDFADAVAHLSGKEVTWDAYLQPRYEIPDSYTIVFSTLDDGADTGILLIYSPHGVVEVDARFEVQPLVGQRRYQLISSDPVNWGPFEEP